MKKTATNIKSLIVVEDDSDDQYFLKTAFEEIGFNQYVLYLNSAEELFEYLESTVDRSGYPYAILLDYNMPVMNGEQALIKLKKHSSYKNIKVLIYSTNISKTQIEDLKKIGADGCYIKSFASSAIIDFARFLQQKIAQAVFR